MIILHLLQKKKYYFVNKSFNSNRLLNELFRNTLWLLEIIPVHTWYMFLVCYAVLKWKNHFMLLWNLYEIKVWNLCKFASIFCPSVKLCWHYLFSNQKIWTMGKMCSQKKVNFISQKKKRYLFSVSKNKNSKMFTVT